MVDKNRMLEEFKKLVAFDSESFKELDISKYLFNKLKELGLQVEIDNAGMLLNPNVKATGNIYGFLKGNTEGDSILLSAHMDTVSPGVGKIAIINDDGTVTSDGKTILGADDITGIVSILEALTIIKERNLKHPDIEVVFFIAEEPYCRGSSVFDFGKIKSKYGYVLDLSGKVGTIALEAPSIYQFKIKINGKSAHAGFEPEKGVSAIVIASLAISKLKLGRIDSDTTSNIGMIRGGNGKNIIPDNVILEGEIRSVSDIKALNEANNIKKTFLAEAEDFGASIEFELNEMIKSYKLSKYSYVVKKYQDTLKQLNYGDASYITTFGGSDANSINKNGIECAVISNAMNNVHTTNEHFEIDEFVKSAEICLSLIRGEWIDI